MRLTVCFGNSAVLSINLVSPSYRHFSSRQLSSYLSTMISSTVKASVAAVSRPCRSQALAHPRVCNTPRCQLATVGMPIHRQLSHSVKLTHPRKDSQDKDSINTEATEYSKSATDDEGARQEDAAFNPNITDPQQQKDKAGESTEGTVSKQV